MLDLRPLRSAGFRHLAAASWINEFGNFVGEIALTLLAYNRTHSPLISAALFLSLRFLPAAVAPLLTVRLEVVSTRKVLAVLYLMEGLLFACLAALTRHFSLPAVFGLGALDGALGITAKALLRGSRTAELLSQGLLREGNAILNLGVMAATAGSPVIAGALVAWKGAGLALLVDAATFLLAAVVVMTATGLGTINNSDASVMLRLRDSLSTLTGRGPLPKLMVAIAVVILVSSVPVPVEVVFARRTLHAGASGYGLLLGSWGVGMVIGGACFAAAREMRLMTLVGAGTLVAAAGYAGLAVSPTLAAACACSVIGGIGNGTGWIAALTSVQERIPAGAQSAVMSVLGGVNQVMPAVGFVLGGVLTELSSPRIAYAVAAVGTAACVLGAWKLSVGRSEIYLRPPSEPGANGSGRANLQDAQSAARNAMSTRFIIG